MVTEKDIAKSIKLVKSQSGSKLLSCNLLLDEWVYDTLWKLVQDKPEYNIDLICSAVINTYILKDYYKR